MSSALPPLIWLDLEMTGLEPETCTILEIATVITDGALEIIAVGPALVIHQPDATLTAMDAWNTEHHGRSGLTAAVRASTISLAEAERLTLEFLGAHCEPGLSPLCGNSIAQDRRFLRRYMPALSAFFHYRSVDVTTIKELARRWYPEQALPAKPDAHRALDDVMASIDELRHYRRALFR